MLRKYTLNESKLLKEFGHECNRIASTGNTFSIPLSMGNTIQKHRPILGRCNTNRSVHLTFFVSTCNVFTLSRKVGFIRAITSGSDTFPHRYRSHGVCWVTAGCKEQRISSTLLTKCMSIDLPTGDVSYKSNIQKMYGVRLIFHAIYFR